MTDEVPLRVEDVFAMKIKMNMRLINELQDVCFDACKSEPDVAMVSYSEGLCMRNCMTKYSVWEPTLKQNLMGSALSEYTQMLD